MVRIKIQEILNILYDEHKIIIEKQRCKQLIRRYPMRPTLNKLINYIIETTNESSESISISDDSDSDQKTIKYDLTYIKRYVLSECGLTISNDVIQHYIDNYAKYDSSNTNLLIAKSLVLPSYLRYHDYPKKVQELIDTQSTSLLKDLLNVWTSGWLLIYYTGEQTDDIINLIKKYSEPYYIDINYIKTHTEELCIKFLREDPLVFRNIKIPHTPKMCSLAIRNGLNIMLIPPELLSENLCVSAVIQNHQAFKYIPMKYQTVDVWLNYLLSDVSQFKENIEKLPTEYASQKFYRVLFRYYTEKNVKDIHDLRKMHGCINKYILEEFQRSIIEMVNKIALSKGIADDKSTTTST